MSVARSLTAYRSPNTRASCGVDDFKGRKSGPQGEQGDTSAVPVTCGH
jgi:hypothetical protein